MALHAVMAISHLEEIRQISTLVLVATTTITTLPDFLPCQELLSFNVVVEAEEE